VEDDSAVLGARDGAEGALLADSNGANGLKGVSDMLIDTKLTLPWPVISPQLDPLSIKNAAPNLAVS
jgi:hypothetical protein